MAHSKKGRERNKWEGGRRERRKKREEACLAKGQRTHEQPARERKLSA